MAGGGAIIRVQFELMLEPKYGHYSNRPWAIIYVRPVALGQVRRSVNYYHMQLNMFNKFVENNVPINQQEG